MQFAAESRSGPLDRFVKMVASGAFVLLLLLIGEMMLAARAIELANWNDGAVSLWPMAVAGVLFGLVAARIRVPDLFSHLSGLFLGVLAAFVYATRFLDAPEESLAQRVELLFDTTAAWIRDSIGSRQTRDELVLIIAMGLLLWLIGYISAWFLFRRGWFLPAVVLPGIPIGLNLGSIDDGRSAALLIYVLLALCLAAVQVARLRTAQWRNKGLAFSTIAWRAPAVSGALIALLAVSLAWSSPVSPPESWVDAAAERLEAPISAVDSAWQDLNRRLSPPAEGGEFAEFGNSFEMGGELNLGDEPVALLEADRPHYLAAQRYDIYTGSGWDSSAPDAVLPVGATEPVDAPLVAFQPGQEVYLSDDIMGGRIEVGGTIQVLAPTGHLLFTIETYSGASAPISATLSWRELNDERFDLIGSDLRDVPVELRNLAMLLQAATFEPSEGGLVATDAPLDRRIKREILDLRTRYLSVRVSIDPDGVAIALHATGYVPNYDDIESIALSNRVQVGDRYSVIGWESVASADELRAAPFRFPGYITDRYLNLPESVSDETRGLALSVTQGTETVFDTALAIQTYLRLTYPYEESIPGPRDGVDAVHYFLFDEQQGYCEYFASAMVVMLRSLDVPSRLVSGLMEVPWDPGEGGYLYRQKQAHTWVEVYFEGYGWVPFEPTPSRGAFDYEGEEPEREDPPTPTPEPVTPTIEAEPTTTVEPTEEPEPGIAVVQTDDDGGRPWLTGGLIAGGLALAGTLFWLAFRANRTAIGGAPGAHYYRQLVKSARQYGVLPSATTTPRELASQLGEVAPAAEGPATEISRLYRKELYAGQALTPDEQRIGEGAIKRIRQLLRADRFRRGDRNGSGQR